MSNVIFIGNTIADARKRPLSDLLEKLDDLESRTVRRPLERTLTVIIKHSLTNRLKRFS